MAEENKVGGEILSYCTKCKMDLNHVIVAMKGDKVAKVECRTCDKTHAYRVPKGVTEPPKKRTRRAKSDDKPSTVEEEWKKLMAAKEGEASKNYNMKGHFDIGDKISHKTFGEGVVGKVIYPNKIEVIFQMDVKKLIHAGPAPRA